MVESYVCPMCGSSLIVVGNMYVCADNKCCYTYPLEGAYEELNSCSQTLEGSERDAMSSDGMNAMPFLTYGEGLDGLEDSLNNFAESITETAGNTLNATVEGSGEIIEGIVENATDAIAEGIMEEAAESITEVVVEGIADAASNLIGGMIDSL